MRSRRWQGILVLAMAIAAAWAAAFAQAGAASGVPSAGGRLGPSRQEATAVPPTATPVPATATPVPAVQASFERTVSGPDIGSQRIGPDTVFQMEVAVTVDTPVNAATLTETLPDSFTIVDAGGGAVTGGQGVQQIAWSLDALPAGVRTSRVYTLRSPVGVNPPASYSFQADLAYEGGNAAGPAGQYLVASSVVDDHYRFGENEPLDAMRWMAGPDGPVSGIDNRQRFRIRFQLHNPDVVDVDWTPQLEWATAPGGPYQRVMLDAEEYDGAPFVVQPVDPIADGQSIPPSLFALPARDGTPVAGGAFDERNPAPSLTLPANSYTEVEFSVRSTVWISWDTSYFFRVTDGGRALSGGAVALAITEPLPPEPTPVGDTYPAETPTPTPAPASLSPQAFAGAGGPVPLAPTPFLSPHNGYTATTDKCATCHRAHTASGPNVIRNPMPVSNLCFTCHDTAGTGSNYKTQAQYTDPNVTPNDPATGAFYSHPATSLTPTGHVNAYTDEFRGVFNRHAECTDCHNPHQADPNMPTPTSSGWQVSGALKGISGVNVTNSLTPGATPVYAWTTAVAYGYQLCLKCHSGYTTLRTYTKDSDKKWDKATEFNPNNASNHAIEGPGKNTTSRMATSLAGTSAYKMWTFTTSETLRCEYCHGDYRLATTPGPGVTPPAKDARLNVHSSKYRGILMNNYRWRTLKSSSEPFNAADFALCFQCHGSSPFTDTSGNSRSDTNFRFHGYHVAKITGQGSGGTDITTPGAGQGNAVCAECHYRVHSTTYAYHSDQVNELRGVNFAPDVLPTAVAGAPRIDITPGNPDSGRCYLTCHGKNHNPKSY